MAVYMIDINERTKAGKGLVQYLRALGVIKERENDPVLDPTNCDAYREAMKDVEEGRIYSYSTLDEFKSHIIADAEI